MSSIASNFPAFKALVLAELRLYFSSRRTLVMNILALVLIGAFFGYVTNPKDQTAPHVPVAVVDRDGSAMTKAIIEAMSKNASLNVTLADEAQARKLVSEGKAARGDHPARAIRDGGHRAVCAGQSAEDHHRRRP